ncbi:uncharacterized protein LOC141601981 [Silene latifolia]|uniref:uncharacterized protein LOC141601981 n=1 Tax=Silene latifolia TaxID=37657 RepID=UPI003D788F4A
MHRNNVGLFGLLETKVKTFSLNSLNGILMDGWSISTNNRWQKGGRIWVLWNPSIYHVDFQDYSSQCINIRVIEVATSTKFCVSMVYAVNDLNGRHELWDQLTTFATHVTEPWLVCGDFNCVLSYAERLGSSTNDQDIDEFQNCISKCGVIDCPAMGSFFTWNNKQEIRLRVYRKLDRALINQEWSKGMPDMYAHFLPEGTFDHTPCILKSSGQGGTQRKPFKYFNMWGKAANYLPLLAGW